MYAHNTYIKLLGSSYQVIQRT